MNLSDYLLSEPLSRQAVTHRSYCNEHPGTPSNERLEFLGDAVLALIISDRLFRLLPDIPEGELTARRSFLVQTATLAEKAKNLKLDQKLLLSRGEEESGGRRNPSLLADTFEAVLGAVFINSGLEICYNFLTEIFPDSEIVSEKINAKDPKSLLQELSQSHNWGTPIYHTITASGPDHAKQFTVSVSVHSQPVASGMGPSKQKAQTAAAGAAVVKLFPTHDKM